MKEGDYKIIFDKISPALPGFKSHKHQASTYENQEMEPWMEAITLKTQIITPQTTYTPQAEGPPNPISSACDNSSIAGTTSCFFFFFLVG